MKIITVDNLKEGDVLAKDVLLPDYTVLLGKGTVIKQEYIEKLQEYFIITVYIETTENKKEEEQKQEIPKQEPEVSIVEEPKLKQEPEIHDNIEAKTEQIIEAPKKSQEYKIKRSSVDLEKLHENVEDKINKKINDFIELHSLEESKELNELAKTAGKIIKDLLEDPVVLDKVYEVKERGADVYEHSLSTCTIATIVALKMGYSETDVYDISVSAILHDIGLRYLKVKYENKDINLLSKADQEEYKKHGLYAYTSIKDETWISQRAKEMILGHHERKDGNGFPLGKKEVSRECQIVGICDEFDELICGIGKAKIRVHEAISLIRNYNGIWFDSDIVDTFLSLIAVYPVGTKVRTNKGQIAVVINQNKHFPERPVIRVLEDKYFKNMTEGLTINLVTDTKVVIEEVLK